MKNRVSIIVLIVSVFIFNYIVANLVERIDSVDSKVSKLLERIDSVDSKVSKIYDLVKGDVIDNKTQSLRSDDIIEIIDETIRNNHDKE